MESCVKTFLGTKGYTVNEDALQVIQTSDDWYANRPIEGFHNRRTINGVPYQLTRLNLAKRGCSDDANLCEVIDINAGEGEQTECVREVLKNSNFETQYRRQLEKTSANGTVACYLRLDNATFMSDSSVKGGRIKLNYVDADAFLPLTVEDGIVTEAAFSGSAIKRGKKRTTLVLFTLDEKGQYIAETHIFDEYGKELMELSQTVQLGEIKPFAVMRTADVNNQDNMEGYGLPRVWQAIPALRIADLCYNVLFSDLDKAEKIILVNELLCEVDEDGKPKMTPEQKKLFVLLGEKLPAEKDMIQEYNPKVRIEEITKSFELALSLLSMMFGYGTKKYSFDNVAGVTTATEFKLSRQDEAQELNRQRQEAIRYIQDICRAILWFANTFQQKSYNVDTEVLVDFDDSIITDKDAELEKLRADALSFDIPELTIRYLCKAYNMQEDEARKLVEQKEQEKEEDTGGDEDE